MDSSYAWLLDMLHDCRPCYRSSTINVNHVFVCMRGRDMQIINKLDLLKYGSMHKND